MRIIKYGASAAVGLFVAFTVFVTCFTNHSYVTTPSMYPTIPPGSLIFFRPDPHPHVGQVIEFRGNGLTWAHRLIKIKPNGDLVTKGDNPENSPDVFVPPLTRKDILGVAYLAPRWVGFPELILHHPGYGLSWLRAELGLWGRIGLTLVLGALAWLLVRPDRTKQPIHRRRGRRLHRRGHSTGTSGAGGDGRPVPVDDKGEEEPFPAGPGAPVLLRAGTTGTG